MRTVFLLFSVLVAVNRIQVVVSIRECPVNGCGPFGTCEACLDTDSCQGGKHCKCEEGYAGYDCSLPMELCPRDDDDNNNNDGLSYDGTQRGVWACFNGGKCRPKKQPQSQPRLDTGETTYSTWYNYYCDCSSAVGQAGTMFAGDQCEYSYVTSCEIGRSFSTYAFCVNGGQCLQQVQPGEAHPGCFNCPGFEGRHCQYALGTAPAQELQDALLEEIKSSRSAGGGDNKNGMSTLAACTFGVLLAGILALSGLVAFYRRRNNSNAVTLESAKNSIFLVETNTNTNISMSSSSYEDDHHHPQHETWKNLHDPSNLEERPRPTFIETLATRIAQKRGQQQQRWGHHHSSTTSSSSSSSSAPGGSSGGAATTMGPSSKSCDDSEVADTNPPIMDLPHLSGYSTHPNEEDGNGSPPPMASSRKFTVSCFP
ncbi:hypothetical protein ACA910_002583 [Epithemia clementina (nom. ined.)]